MISVSATSLDYNIKQWALIYNGVKKSPTPTAENN